MSPRVSIFIILHPLLLTILHLLALVCFHELICTLPSSSLTHWGSPSESDEESDEEEYPCDHEWSSLSNLWGRWGNNQNLLGFSLPPLQIDCSTWLATVSMGSFKTYDATSQVLIVRLNFGNPRHRLQSVKLPLYLHLFTPDFPGSEIWFLSRI